MKNNIILILTTLLCMITMSNAQTPSILILDGPNSVEITDVELQLPNSVGDTLKVVKVTPTISYSLILIAREYRGFTIFSAVDLQGNKYVIQYRSDNHRKQECISVMTPDMTSEEYRIYFKF